jgi:hypothetical protein
MEISMESINEVDDPYQSFVDSIKSIFRHFNATCEYVDSKTHKRCTSQQNLTTHHKNGDSSDDSVKNLDILCLHHHRKIEGILNKKRDFR